MRTCLGLVMAVCIFVTGCAKINFTADNGLLYFEPKPYLLITTNKDCVPTVSVIMLPNTEKHIAFESGYGSAELSVALTNGMITSAGQKTDTKIPETITSIAGLATAAGGLTKIAAAKESPPKYCDPYARLFEIAYDKEGHLKFDKEVSLPIPPAK